jgi:hypothetical protein
MEGIFEAIFNLLIEFWASLLEKIWDPTRSRGKRVLSFLLFYLPVAAVLVIFGSLAYDRTDIVCIIISYALYALAAFLFFWLGKKAWFGKAPKEPKAIEKMGNGIEKFINGYKNTMDDKSAPIKTKILLLSFPLVPMIALLVILTLLLPEATPVFLVGFGIYLVCYVILAIKIFRKK